MIVDDYKGDACDRYNLGIGFYEVYPETVCQYMGLYDSTRWKQIAEEEQKEFLSKWNQKENRYNQKEDWKGKKIWENDIVKVTHYQYGYTRIYYRTVKFCNGKYALFDKDNKIDWKYDDFSFCSYRLFFQSVGNIFDNPELLEV